MAFAEVALGSDPIASTDRNSRNYEIWYVYATGYNAPLNKIINETLARNGKLTEADLEQIYETYLSHIKTTDRIDKVGARVIGEIDDVMKVLSEALGMTGSYDASLSGATEQAVVGQEPRPDQVDRRDAAAFDQRDARDQQGAGRPADPVEERDQQSPAEPGGDPRREPDRSAHGIGQPQIFRSHDRHGRAERARRAASRCRCCCSTSIISSRSTIPTAISPATRCCGWSACR